MFETFRGVSHLLMEKVTRELRRSPSRRDRDPSPARPPLPPPLRRRPSRADRRPLRRSIRCSTRPRPRPRRPRRAAPAAPAAAPTRETPVFKTPRPEPAPVQPEPVTMRSEPVVAKPRAAGTGARDQLRPRAQASCRGSEPREDLDRGVHAPERGRTGRGTRVRVRARAGPFETFESSGDRLVHPRRRAQAGDTTRRRRRSGSSSGECPRGERADRSVSRSRAVPRGRS